MPRKIVTPPKPKPKLGGSFERHTVAGEIGQHGRGPAHSVKTHVPHPTDRPQPFPVRTGVVTFKEQNYADPDAPHNVTFNMPAKQQAESMDEVNERLKAAKTPEELAAVVNANRTIGPTTELTAAEKYMKGMQQEADVSTLKNAIDSATNQHELDAALAQLGRSVPVA